MAADMDLRRVLASNIFICGQTSQIPGLAARIQKEISKRMPFASRIRVRQADTYSTWQGGSNIGAMPQFHPSL